MEKLLRRSILHRNQLVGKKKRESARELRKEWRNHNRFKNMQQTEMQRLVQQERTARREDWILGPLAPKRDFGSQKPVYGALNSLLARAPALPKREMRAPRGHGSDPHRSEERIRSGREGKAFKEWEGEFLEANLVEGDRVVVIKGRPGLIGTIGEVASIELESRTLFLKDANKVDMIIPPPNRPAGDPGASLVFEGTLPIPISDVRLVTRQTDELGVERDVIVRTVIGQGPYIQRSQGSNLPRHTRYVAGGWDGNSRDVEIPWPQENPVRENTQTGDTTSLEVEKETFVPSLLSKEGPLAHGAIDELRKPHSRSRREYDSLEMMQQKLLEDARRDWFAQRSKMLSKPFWTREFMQREQKAGRVAQAKSLQDVDV